MLFLSLRFKSFPLLLLTWAFMHSIQTVPNSGLFWPQQMHSRVTVQDSTRTSAHMRARQWGNGKNMGLEHRRAGFKGCLICEIGVLTTWFIGLLITGNVWGDCWLLCSFTSSVLPDNLTGGKWHLEGQNDLPSWGVTAGGDTAGIWTHS